MLQAAATNFTKALTDIVQRLIADEFDRRSVVAVPLAIEGEPKQTSEEVNAVAAVEQAVSDAPRPEQQRSEVTVLLWSSEITAYMGNDSWMSRTQALAKVWRRTHEASYRDTHEKWLLRGQKPLHVTSKQVLAVGAGLGPRGGNTKPRYSADPFVGVQSAADVEKFRRTRSQKDLSRLYRGKGKLLEEETALLFEREIGQPVELRNAGVFWDATTAAGQGGLRPLQSVRPPGPILAPGPYNILGEVDGCLLQPPFANVPVEFKLRMGAQGVSNSIPFKDIVQVQSYMEMLDAERALHVQRAFGTSTVVSTIVERDRDLWTSKILPAIEEFVCDVRKLLRGCYGDEELRHTVLRSVESSKAPPLQEASAIFWHEEEPKEKMGVDHATATSPILAYLPDVPCIPREDLAPQTETRREEPPFKLWHKSADVHLAVRAETVSRQRRSQQKRPLDMDTDISVELTAVEKEKNKKKRQIPTPAFLVPSAIAMANYNLRSNSQFTSSRKRKVKEISQH